MNKNVIQFRNKFVNLPNAGQNNHQMAMSVTSELMQFGFLLNSDAINNLASASKEDIIKFHNETITYLKDITGSNRDYKPFWSGFPDQVMEKSESELWMHQIVHYASNGTYEPTEWTKERPTVFEQTSCTIVTSGTDVDFNNIFTNLISVNSSLTPDDMEIVKWFASNCDTLAFPNVIPFKENLCTLASMGLDVPVSTVTDVLRIAVGMSGGDVSLPKVPYKKVRINAWSSELSDNPKREDFKFKKFNRSDRRLILTLLEKTNCDASEAVVKDQRWIRLGEIIHPGEYKNRFPKSFLMFNDIRNGNVKSWYSKVNKGFDKSLSDGLKVLSERPGEFMRKIDWLIRSNTGKDVYTILDTLKNVSTRVSQKVLFEVFTHFEGRDCIKTGRTIMVKGSRKRTALPDLPAISGACIENIQDIILNALKSKFSTLDSLGSVFVDEELKKIPLPTNMRSISSSLKPTIRGQRIPIGNQDSKVIRAYVHWFDEYGNEDIDLSATFIGMGKSSTISWDGVSRSKYGVYSGDVRHRTGSCAEYIDININESIKAGYKYVIIRADNYEGRGFDTMKECVFGYMERENSSANKTFKPDTIANSMLLQSTSTSTIVAIIDVETREYIYLDIDSDNVPVASADFNTIMKAIKPYCEMPKVSVYDLAMMHVESRGGVIKLSPEDAETTFKYEDFSESYVETLNLMGV